MPKNLIKNLRSCKKLHRPVVFSVFFIFSMWKPDSEKSPGILCCIKKQRKICSFENATENSRTKGTEVAFHNSSQKCFSVGGKRNCQLPPVPVNTGTGQAMSTPSQGRVVDITDGARPYSLCEPSESDPLYASVGIPGISATPRTNDRQRSRVIVESDDAEAVMMMTMQKSPVAPKVINSAGRIYTTVDSADSGSATIPYYYSSIAHAQDSSNPDSDPRSSPCYQEEPLIPTHVASQDVYAQVLRKSPGGGGHGDRGRLSSSLHATTAAAIRLRSNEVYGVKFSPLQANQSACATYRRTVKSHEGAGMAVDGPPVPSRAYRLSEVEHLLDLRPRSSPQGRSNHQPINESTRVREISVGLQLLGLIQSGLRRRSRGSNPRNSLNAEDFRPSVAEVVPHPANRVSGEYSTYGSGRSGNYRSITVRESIASLRARNALPTFLTDSRPFNNAVTLAALHSGRLSDAEYEGVYWYPNDECAAEGSGSGRAGANRCTSSSGSPAPGHRDSAVDPGSDAYVEIPEGAIQSRPQSSTFVVCVGTVEKRRHPSSGDNIYSLLKSEGASDCPAVFPVTPHGGGVARILLEMQDFRYVDSETDISSSVTPPELVDPERSENDLQSLPMQTSTSVQGKLNIVAPNQPVGLTRPLKMTPLMERSVEAESIRSVAASVVDVTPSPSENGKSLVKRNSQARGVVHYENLPL